MLRRSLLACVAMLASTAGFAGAASADTADTATVTFSGSIPGVCRFDNATGSGSLASYSSDYYLLAYPGLGGTMPTLNVTCNAPGSVSIGATTPSASNPVATSVYAGFNNGSYIDSNPVYVEAGSTVPVSVGMYATNQDGGTLPSGNYEYTVTLTAAGN
ncbi:hypothetical protein [Cylindrospermum sp. FACHB-282]|uniref:hypothetical protein n=1 Tax=Cylindrospermum sp. FACHB-282 TaxID=2692794 RepID=UPI00168481A0|nr:hypothetical protein [Cylindrospermum sp. FACHB-282]MBD2387291.1 hypothetical protein [Cylindrospermum sp. FACHB-282]